MIIYKIPISEKKNSEAEKRIIFMINLASQNGQHTLVFLGNWNIIIFKK